MESTTISRKRYLDEDYDAPITAPTRTASLKPKLAHITTAMPLTPPATPSPVHRKCLTSYIDTPYSNISGSSSLLPPTPYKRRRIERTPSTRAKPLPRRSRRLNPLTIRIRVPTHMRNAQASGVNSSTDVHMEIASNPPARRQRTFLPYRRPTSLPVYRTVLSIDEKCEKLVIHIRVPKSMKSTAE